MNSRQVIIHIGTEKTGTTSLQRYLYQNAPLLEKAGIWYPADASKSYCERAAHFPIAGALVDQWRDFVSPSKERGLGTVVEEFRGDASRQAADIILISAEHFSSRVKDSQRLAAFRDALLKGFGQIRIVCYIRRQPEMALSSYYTGVVNGRRAPLDPSAIPVDDPFFNYLKLLDLWAGVFGPECITVREYDRKKLAAKDIGQDFCLNVLGVDTSAFTPVSDRNTSQGAVLVEFIRQLNLVLPRLEEDHSGWRSAQQLRSFVLRHLTIKNDRRLTFSPSEEQALLQRFAEINQEINRRYLKGSMSRNWFEAEGTGTEADRLTDKALAERTLNAMSELIVQMLKSSEAGRPDAASAPRR